MTTTRSTPAAGPGGRSRRVAILAAVLLLAAAGTGGALLRDPIRRALARRHLVQVLSLDPERLSTNVEFLALAAIASDPGATRVFRSAAHERLGIGVRARLDGLGELSRGGLDEKHWYMQTEDGAMLWWLGGLPEEGRQILIELVHSELAE